MKHLQRTIDERKHSVNAKMLAPICSPKQIARAYARPVKKRKRTEARNEDLAKLNTRVQAVLDKVKTPQKRDEVTQLMG